MTNLVLTALAEPSKPGKMYFSLNVGNYHTLSSGNIVRHLYSRLELSTLTDVNSHNSIAPRATPYKTRRTIRTTSRMTLVCLRLSKHRSVSSSDSAMCRPSNHGRRSQVHAAGGKLPTAERSSRSVFTNNGILRKAHVFLVEELSPGPEVDSDEALAGRCSLRPCIPMLTGWLGSACQASLLLSVP